MSNISYSLFALFFLFGTVARGESVHCEGYARPSGRLYYMPDEDPETSVVADATYFGDDDCALTITLKDPHYFLPNKVLPAGQGYTIKGAYKICDWITQTPGYPRLNLTTNGSDVVFTGLKDKKKYQVRVAHGYFKVIVVKESGTRGSDTDFIRGGIELVATNGEHLTNGIYSNSLYLNDGETTTCKVTP